MNVGRLPLQAPHPKQDALHHHIHHNKIDILGISEVGLNWGLISNSLSWHERTFKVFRTQSTVLAWNRHDLHTSPLQWGGVGLISSGLITSRVIHKGSDHRGLGRWCWTTYTGSHSSKITIYSIYRPVLNKSGPLSVYQQQHTHLLKKGSPITDPLSIFESDLFKELNTRIQRGELLIIGGDINDNILTSSIHRTLLSLELQEAVLTTHSSTPNFSSHIRNNSHRIIDGIWTSPTLTIINSGYTSFDVWDHRMPWLELDLSSTFGSNQSSSNFTGRRLKIQDSKTTNKYLSYLVPHIQHHDLLSRARTLNSQVQSTLSPAQQQELEELDRIRTDLMLAAERQCRKLRMGKVPFSPIAMKAALAKSYWRLVLRKKSGRPVSSRLLQRKRHQAGIPPHSISSLTLPTIISNIQKYHSQWLQLKAQAKTLREAFLTQQADSISSSTLTRATAIKRILRQEKARHGFRKIKHTLKGPRTSGLTRLFGPPDSQGHRTHHTSSQAISQCCITANAAKYRQTQQTPFMTHPLVQAVGYHGFTPQSSSILQGKFSHPSLDPYTNAHLRELQRPDHIPPWPPELLHISVSEHRAAWRKAKEKTSSSPSGLHFGLWKTNATHPDLCEIDTILRAIPFRTGYSLQRWLKGIDVELQKDPAN